MVRTTRLAGIASAFNSNKLLEQGSLVAVVKVLGLGDSVVLLAVANFISLGANLNFLVQLLLSFPPFLFQLQRPVLGQLMDSV